MKKLRWIIPALLVGALVFALDGTVSWTPPTEWEDGTPLAEQDLDYYSVYCDGSTTPFAEIDNIIGTRTAVVNFGPLGEGTHTCHLTVTALNGQESSPSNTANFIVGPRIPGAATNFVITL